jgi:hypothetical protein
MYALVAFFLLWIGTHTINTAIRLFNWLSGAVDERGRRATLSHAAWAATKALGGFAAILGLVALVLLNVVNF